MPRLSCPGCGYTPSERDDGGGGTPHAAVSAPDLLTQLHTLRRLALDVKKQADAMKADRERFKKFFHGMLDAGVYLAPSQFEAGFISTAHSEADIEQTVSAVARVMRQL